MLEITLTASIQLKMVLASNLWTVWLDEGDLEDAIINLVINAMHSIEGNGRIIIETRNERLNVMAANLLDLRCCSKARLRFRPSMVNVFKFPASTSSDSASGHGASMMESSSPP